MFRNSQNAIGKLGDAQGTLNDGQLPLLIDVYQIASIAVIIQFTRDLLLAQVLAHEVGHKFGQIHLGETTASTTAYVFTLTLQARLAIGSIH